MTNCRILHSLVHTEEDELGKHCEARSRDRMTACSAPRVIVDKSLGRLIRQTLTDCANSKITEIMECIGISTQEIHRISEEKNFPVVKK